MASLAREVRIGEIGESIREGSWISIKAKIAKIWNSNSESISQTGLLGDESGQMKFVSWKKSNLPELKEGESYLIKNAVVDKWNGNLQVSLNRKSEIKRMGKGRKIQNRVLEGEIKRIIPKSGYIERCPECGRVLVDNHCVVHVDVEPVGDLRIKAAVNNKIAIIKGETAESLLNITIEEAKSMSEEELSDLIKKKVLDKKFKFEGTDYGEYFHVIEWKG